MNLRTHGLVSALIVLAILSVLLATQFTVTEARPVEAVPVKATDPVTEEAPKPSAKASRKSKESAYEKLALNKLVIERPTPKEPAQEPERNPEKESKNHPRAQVASVPVLPGPQRKVPPQNAPKREAPKQSYPQAPSEKPKPRDTRLLLSVPRLGLKDVMVRDSPEQAYLDREGIMHLSGTGFPYERGSNTYIAGHAGDFDTSRIPNVFRNLKNLRRGDLILLRDATGRTYNYRVYERLLLTPRDVWVTKPVAGKKIVSLQTCFPAPTFNKRLIVRGELVQ